jgi:hypothetical protein
MLGAIVSSRDKCMSEGGILSEELVSVDGERDGTSDNLPPSFIVLALAVGNAVQEAGCVGVGAMLQRRGSSSALRAGRHDSACQFISGLSA